MNYSNLAKYFLRTVVVILIVTAGMKLLSAFNDAKYLVTEARLFEFLTNRQLIAFTACLELGVVAYLLTRSASQVNKLAAVTWLSSLFLTYRLLLFVLKIPLPCSCLGYAADWLPIKLSTIELTMKFVLGYMFLGSLVLWSTLRSQDRRPPVEPLTPGSANLEEAV